ncbi:MAG TPA: hypothetical protein PK954_17775 [Anaerolineales bacterium]|nr:hypothetical protein [Anaerolineales bacterium]
MKRAIRLGVLLLLSLGWVLGMRSSGPFAPLAAQAQGGRVFYISEVDSSKFPRVSFRLRVVDSQANRVVTGLTDRDIAIYENGVQQTGVTVSAQNTGPVFFTFLIDQGRSHNYNAFGNQNSGLLQAVSDLVNGGAFQPGGRAKQLQRQQPDGDRLWAGWRRAEVHQLRQQQQCVFAP